MAPSDPTLVARWTVLSKLRLALVRTFLVLYGLAFGASLCGLARVLYLYSQGPDAGLGPCGPMGVLTISGVVGFLALPGIAAFCFHQSGVKVVHGRRNGPRDS